MQVQTSSTDYDIAIIGGGINGAGIARDAAGRGYKVLLVEQDDLASHTSSSSSKLIHGGLRYLEYYEFKLVREALSEREVLLNIAPHIIWPLRFILPHNKKMRPVWMIRAGLWLYDHLGKRMKLPSSNSINLSRHAGGKSLKSQYKKGFIYSDCWVQDSRLVVLNAMDAHQNGAQIKTRTKCVAAQGVDGHWQLTLADQHEDQKADKKRDQHCVTAKMMVNAAGPWVADFLINKANVDHHRSIRLVSGGHIVVPKLFDHNMAYIFQNEDNRIVFAIPYETDYTLIGTTELEVESGQKGVITNNEIKYLCDSINQYFDQNINPDDVVWSYCGVRPLLQDGSDDATSATREYVLDLTQTPAPCLSVFGGKITTYRSLSEKAMEKIDSFYNKPSQAWTGSKPLPGGEFAVQGFDEYLSDFRKQTPWLPESLSWHYVRNYGTRVELICEGIGNLEDLGRHFGAQLYQAEVDYLVKHEWAMTHEDILWRRTKWGLRLTNPQIEELKNYLEKVNLS